MELAIALLWLSVQSVQAGGGWPEPWRPWAGLVLVGLLLPLVLIDLDHLWLPEPLCRWGVLIGLLGSVSAGWTFLADHLVAASMALVLLEGLSGMAERLLGQPALGLGDAKLAALGGAWLGAVGIDVAMALATLSGAVVGSLGRVSGRLQPRQAFALVPSSHWGTGWSGSGGLTGGESNGSSCWVFNGANGRFVCLCSTGSLTAARVSPPERSPRNRRRGMGCGASAPSAGLWFTSKI